MRSALKLHPDYLCEAVTRIEVEIARARPGGVELRFSVTGETAGLALPPRASPSRGEGLWRHTCFEMFVLTPPGGYYEFNFAPSGHWAAYRFAGRRSGMSNAELEVPPIKTSLTPQRFDLTTSLSLAHLPHLPCDAPWTLGLSAVIEEANGRKSYWALAHPARPADFHHPDCFAAELAPPF